MNNIKQSRKYLWYKYKHLFYLSYYLLLGILYVAFNHIVTDRTYMYLPVLDDRIPFIKEMVIPYVIWYIYIVIPIVYLAFKDIESYTKLCLFLFIGMTICFLIFAIFPNGQNLRPEITGNDIYSRLIQGIYSTDKPINSAPSMHTLNALAIHFVLIKSKSFKDKKFLKTLSFLIMVLIICSTVMIKQHSIIDVFAGIALGIGLNAFIYSERVTEYIKKISSKGVRLFEKQPCVVSDLRLFIANIKGETSQAVSDVNFD